MSYIGNQPLYTSYITDRFSGNGSTLSFTLSIAPANSASLLVAIFGVLQDPNAYGVVGNTLTFTGPPPAGTNNISVRYLGLPASNVVTSAYRTVTDIIATAGQTTFSPSSYTPGFIDVYRNGAKLATADYVATNGAQVVLNNAAAAGDIIQTVSFSVGSVLNALPATAGSVGSTNLAAGNATATFLDSGNFNGTGAMVLPTGTTAQRPSAPAAGMHRWNTTTGQAEIFTGYTWQTISLGLYQIDYLVVAGGGSGGGGQVSLGGGGGGGAGGLIYGSMTVGSGTPYSFTIGAGGAAPAVNVLAHGNSGGNTTAFGLTAIGGGGGGYGASASAGYSGGSGGGGGYNGYSAASNGGAGTAGQGNAGSGVSGTSASGGGGGGATSAGSANTGSGGGSGGLGGNGYTWLNGITYATGGQGGAANVNADALNGSGNGSPGAYAAAQTWRGGDGTVIVRYLGNQRASGGTVSSSGGYTYHTFTTSGTFTS